ncbi:Metallothionein-like protein 1 [Morus notabilis]|uniref:Metallothionein-like protein n=1 Tax=Morus notabilis TaxID=981085 RepID=W9RU37_9ROSA|nr:metallothionein-like protein 1 [Morus notabilis]EXC10649.1 Metallothionein-like protein 1 [Morus notabilis]
MSGCNCGSSCSCGSDCKCGKRYPDLGISEENTTVSVIAGFAPTKTYFQEAEMSYGAENGGCDCGADCQCGSSCACGK